MGDPSVRIVVRTDIDWRAMDRAAFLAQSDPTRPLSFVASEPLDLWDEVFAVDFFEYRARLQDLALGSYGRAGAHDLTIGLHEIDEWWDQPGDELIVAMDDDDLLTGPLSHLVPCLTPDVDVLLWPRATLGIAQDGTMAWRRPEIRCIFATNCALRKSFLQRHFDRDDAVRLLADHRLANDRVGEVLGVAADDVALPGFRRLRHPRVGFVDRCFSLKNGHVGSIQLLVQATRHPDPAGSLRRLDLTVPRPIPGYIDALTPEIDALEQIWSSLRPR